LKLNKLLKKFDRIIVWILLTLFMVFMISGYMITKGFIHRYYGIILHTRFDLLIMVIFIIHFTINLKFALMRWKFKDSKKLNLFCMVVGACLLIFIVYLDQFFRL
jgi:hypothetical protein